MTLMPDIWLTADPHFGHANIIRYENRPFGNVHEMDDTLIRRWTECVKPDDEIFVLGDFALCSAERLAHLMQILPGRKRLIKGNHDNRSSKRYHELGFEVLAECGEHVTIGNLILSHIPLELPDPRRLNVHGHVHSHIIEGEQAKYYRCISVEVTDYRPVHLDTIIDTYQERFRGGILP